MTYDELYQYAIFMLSRRDYGTTELKRRLARRINEVDKAKQSTTDERCLEQVIERLLEGQYLDDNRTVYAFFRRYLSKSYGPLRIRQELRQKGFPSEIIERVLEKKQKLIGMHFAKILKRKNLVQVNPKILKREPNKFAIYNIEGLLLIISMRYFN